MQKSRIYYILLLQSVSGGAAITCLYIRSHVAARYEEPINDACGPLLAASSNSRATIGDKPCADRCDTVGAL